jgi:integrase
MAAKVHKMVSPVTGKVSWKVYWRDPEGRLNGKTFGKHKDASDFLAKVAVAKRECRYRDVFDVKMESKTNFNQLADKYVENFETQKGWKSFKSHVVRELREEFGDKKLSQITYMDVETWRNKRKATPTKQGNPRAVGSVNCDMAILGHMLNKGVEWRLLEKSPLKKGARLIVKVDNRRTQFLTEPQIEALLNECPPHLAPIVETALLTGMRKGEILGLKWDQIRNGFVYLEGGMCKSGKGRKIPVSDQLNEVFRKLRQVNQLKSEFVFCDSRGNRCRNVNGAFKSACRRAGIEDFVFHDLRHTFASQLVMKGATINAVQELLGHASLAMTMRYSHLSQEHLKDAVNLFPRMTGVNKVLRIPQKDQKEAANSL